MQLFGLLWLLLPHCLPGVWRALAYWQHCMPLLTTYWLTALRAGRLARAGDVAGSEALWAVQHQRGAQRLFEVLCELKGFYLKLGQILATKTDLLPPAYTDSLAGLLDKLPSQPFHQVVRSLERELGRPLHTLFQELDPFPLASATIGQVHRGVVRLAVPGNKGPAPLFDVAVKVQHPGVRRALRADLANMKLGVDLLDRLGVELGFDLGSVVREYHVAVPLECDFLREAAVQSAVRSSLARHAAAFPLLHRVVVPAVLSSHSSSRVLVMEFLEGVPLLDAAPLGPDTRSMLMQALVMAFGIQILVDGCHHTDPHPGNLMALVRDGQPCVGLLDFGQVRELSPDERRRQALLVLALASRDGDLLRATLAELGVRIENCSEEFVEAAGYILFDTRMDFAEALQRPLDPAANPGWRSARVPRLPRDLFMMMRVITLLRGVMASMHVYDVSSALLWRPLAMQVSSWHHRLIKRGRLHVITLQVNRACA
ncbi:ABC1 family-domain-containing protein [Haematococcus lacustris]